MLNEKYDGSTIDENKKDWQENLQNEFDFKHLYSMVLED